MSRRSCYASLTALLVLVLAVGVGVLLRRARAAPVAAPSPSAGVPGAFVEPGWRRPPFAATVEPISVTLAGEMTGNSWRPDCPVALAELRVVRLTFWGFDHTMHQGELVVHADIADRVVRVFHGVYDAALPIRSIQRVESYGASDEASNAADNTSGFNCRSAGTVRATGKAIDVNPVENPSVRGSTVSPLGGSAFVNRADLRAGMLVKGDTVTATAAAEGFTWGGDRPSATDYQRFEVST